MYRQPIAVSDTLLCITMAVFYYLSVTEVHGITKNMDPTPTSDRAFPIMRTDYCSVHDMNNYSKWMSPT